MLLFNWGWIGAIVIALFVGFVGGCEHEKHEFDKYKSTIEAEAEAQEREAQKTIQKHEQIAREAKSDYENRIAAIRKRYNGLHNNGSGFMPTASETTNGADARPAYDVLAESCAETTQQLVSLQQFVKETQ